MSKEAFRRIGFCFMLCFIAAGGIAQTPGRSFSLIPKRTEVMLNAAVLWDLENSFGKGNWEHVLQELRLQGYVYFSDKVRIEARNETGFSESKTTNELTQLKLNYRNRFRFKSKHSIFRNGITVDADLGKLQWRPRFANTQLILEKARLYFHPQPFYGAGLSLTIPFFKDRSLEVHFRGHSGELINQSDVEPAVQDAYIRIRKFTKYKLGVEAQIGESQASIHVVNYAHLTYKPQVENIIFTIKAGKLPSVDETPYGVHFGIRREFKNVAIGGYYELRINHPHRPHVAGFYYTIIGNSKLAKLFSTFNLAFGFNTNSIFAYIPIAKVAIQHK